MLIAAAAVLIAAGPARQDASALGWMAGSWAAEKDGRWTEERWHKPRGGVMLGTGQSGRDDAADNYEFMRIASGEDGALSFWGSPNGQPPVEFKLTSLSRREAVFENPKHDFPTRIAYRREGNRLVATVSGPDGSGTQSWRYRRR
jgi:hypothetical protein